MAAARIALARTSTMLSVATMLAAAAAQHHDGLADTAPPPRLPDPAAPTTPPGPPLPAGFAEAYMTGPNRYNGETGWTDGDASPTCTSGCGIKVNVGGSDRDVECTESYTRAYMSTINGACSRTFCSAACQALLDDQADKCRGVAYSETDELTGIKAERSFYQKTREALQLMGPVDCSYGDEGHNPSRCATECTVDRILAEDALGGCLSVDLSWPFTSLAAFQSCEGSCRAKFEKLASRCGRCGHVDQRDKDFLEDAGRKFVACAVGYGTTDYTLQSAGTHCDAMEGALESVCRDTRHWPASSAVCSSAVQTAGFACPEQTINDPKMLGFYLDSAKAQRSSTAHCGARNAALQRLFVFAPVDTVVVVYCSAFDGDYSVAMPGSYDPSSGRRLGEHTNASRHVTCGALVVPAHAALGSCDAAGLASGETCEMTCETGYCVTGSQPECGEDGQLHSQMRCELQYAVKTCTFPPHGGCDPHTTCDDAANLFGTRLVKCGPCPSGYYGFGRSGCYTINRCTVLPNGGCDLRTTCTNLDGGYDCSPCSEVIVDGVWLVGGSMSPDGCHLPGSLQQSDKGVSCSDLTGSVDIPMHKTESSALDQLNRLNRLNRSEERLSRSRC